MPKIAYYDPLELSSTSLIHLRFLWTFQSDHSFICCTSVFSKHRVYSRFCATLLDLISLYPPFSHQVSIRDVSDVNHADCELTALTLGQENKKGESHAGGQNWKCFWVVDIVSLHRWYLAQTGLFYLNPIISIWTSLTGMVVSNSTLSAGDSAAL